MKKLILSLILILSAFFANAQVYFKNNYDEPLWVTLGYHVNTKEFEGWKTVGWFKVIPGEKKELLSFNPSGQYLYYHAHTEGRVKSFGGESNLLVHPVNAFKIKNADKEYVKEEHPEYAWYKFIQVDKGKLDALKLKYTIEFYYYGTHGNYGR